MLKTSFFYTFLIALLFGVFPATAQKNGIDEEDWEQLVAIEDSLVVIADSMLGNSIPDDRIEYCINFAKQLRRALDIPGSFNYPFPKLDTVIHIVYPNDRSFRIFNWMIAPAETVRRYYGAIQMAGPEGRLYPLRDNSRDIEERAETMNLTGDQWFGCEYYRILDHEVMGQKTYLLFGQNTDGMQSNKKILDILRFEEQGPVFGAPVFVVPDYRRQGVRTQNRMILEYKKGANASLNYDSTRRMIMFDRLASEINDPNRKNTYAPTGQTDGLRYENGQFIFVRDAIPVLKLKDGQAPVDGVMQGG
jgi:hypothetical protein